MKDWVMSNCPEKNPSRRKAVEPSRFFNVPPTPAYPLKYGVAKLVVIRVKRQKERAALLFIKFDFRII